MPSENVYSARASVRSVSYSVYWNLKKSHNLASIWMEKKKEKKKNWIWQALLTMKMFLKVSSSCVPITA